MKTSSIPLKPYIGGSVIPSFPKNCVTLPARPNIRIHEYAPMKGGENIDITMRMFKSFFPAILKFTIIYANVTPMREARIVERNVTFTEFPMAFL